MTGLNKTDTIIGGAGDDLSGSEDNDILYELSPKDGISTLKDLVLFEKFKEVEKMPSEDRRMIINMIDALLIKSKVESVIKPQQNKDSWESRMQNTLDRLRSRNKDYSEDDILQIVDKAVEKVRSDQKTTH